MKNSFIRGCLFCFVLAVISGISSEAWDGRRFNQEDIQKRMEQSGINPDDIRKKSKKQGLTMIVAIQEELNQEAMGRVLQL